MQIKFLLIVSPLNYIYAMAIFLNRNNVPMNIIILNYQWAIQSNKNTKCYKDVSLKILIIIFIFKKRVFLRG